ncbi:pyridoxamine 5'-phosphate oxidase family protein [Tumebacillus sp. ITR2]|uniref:Pyridoxamine 5'-phosphate oxidase family protein n=1 Tax=Tumebacillus amylolyticus TaxID=2801339 RepID=A0ABS1JAP2_9BACL|nr:pyridoxamine 5'-phosphate oxidase family protein [Tumebacillus amylolyticus]MBL0387346.1 pyridoxamine 5'-phosphate oxidase family protein [Tumebacillus amylolyticus]
MRRKEFTISEQAEIQEFLQEVSYGHLGLIGEDGWPHIVALNFVYHEGHFYFHGSKIGEKIRLLNSDPRVTFNVTKEYSIIPSYFSDPTLACPATAFFKSVLARGHAVIVEDLEEKARAFTAFMQKLQPEGGYDPIDPANDEYRKNLNGVALIRLDVEDLTAKFKFGQNLTEPRRESLIDKLNDRNQNLDAQTIELMKKYCPAHKE